ncbi:hypothetical protein Hanom_Chr01g00091321 [Helianthus anomalus]
MEDAENNHEDLDDDANLMKMSEINTESGRDDSITVKEVPILETSRDINVDNNSPINVDEFPENEEVIPGNLFDFESDLNAEVDLELETHVLNKRKKKGLDLMGRGNPAYSSSLEKTRVGKKPKGDEDLFGLDPLLGLDKSNNLEEILGQDGNFADVHEDSIGQVDSQEADSVDTVISREIDLNSNPCEVNRKDHMSGNTFLNVLEENVVPPFVCEVEATIELGEKLGANFSESLVLDF